MPVVVIVVGGCARTDGTSPTTFHGAVGSEWFRRRGRSASKRGATRISPPRRRVRVQGDPQDFRIAAPWRVSPAVTDRAAWRAANSSAVRASVEKPLSAWRRPAAPEGPGRHPASSGRQHGAEGSSSDDSSAPWRGSATRTAARGRPREGDELRRRSRRRAASSARARAGHVAVEATLRRKGARQRAPRRRAARRRRKKPFHRAARAIAREGATLSAPRDSRYVLRRTS